MSQPHYIPKELNLDTIDEPARSQLKEHFKRVNQLSWKDAVEKVLNDLGGKADLTTIYDRVSGLRDMENNSHFQETVRGTLNSNNDCFISYERGVWELANRNK